MLISSACRRCLARRSSVVICKSSSIEQLAGCISKYFRVSPPIMLSALCSMLSTKRRSKPKRFLPITASYFTDRFTTDGGCRPNGNHLLDLVYKNHGIEHRLIRPGRTQTNGMVERFNGRITDALATRRYISSEDLKNSETQLLAV